MSNRPYLKNPDRLYLELRKLIHNLPEHGVVELHLHLTHEKVNIDLVVEAMDDGVPIVVEGKVLTDAKRFSLITIDD